MESKHEFNTDDELTSTVASFQYSDFLILIFSFLLAKYLYAFVRRQCFTPKTNQHSNPIKPPLVDDNLIEKTQKDTHKIENPEQDYNDKQVAENDLVEKEMRSDFESDLIKFEWEELVPDEEKETVVIPLSTTNDDFTDENKPAISHDCSDFKITQPEVNDFEILVYLI